MLPDLNGKLTGFAVRAPVPTGSVVDLTALLSRETTKEEINEAFKAQADTGAFEGILRYSEDPIVSSDIVKSTHSSIFDSPLTAVLDGTSSRSSPGTTTSGATPTAVSSSRSACWCMRTLDDLDVEGKRVLVRVDFNVPLDDQQKITDDARIRGALPTLEELREQGAAQLILLAHLGRPKEREPEFSLEPAAERLSELLGTEVALAPDFDQVPESDVVMLENVRY